MDALIPRDRLGTHTIDKYKFKLFSSNDKELAVHDDGVFQPGLFSSAHSELVESELSNSDIVSNRDELVESLLKKTDEMSSNFIKLQMKLETSEEECALKVAAAKKEAYEEGKKAALEQFETKFQTDKESVIKQFSESVKKLEESSNEYKSALESIKKELLDAALDIAKEVVEVELTTNSKKVAITLAHELIKDLQSASKIKLKVNPNDHGAVSEKVGSLENIEIISDSAVAPGGVIAISDAGNIDAQILNRYERVKQAALQED